MFTPYQATPDTVVIPMYEKVLGIGLLPVNAFLIRAKEPILIDTGMTRDREEFLATLWSLIEPKDLKWIVMTHEDKDHTGSLQEVLAAAPQARLVTNFLGVGKLMSDWVVPVNRVLHRNTGETFQAGDRTLRIIKPPVYDSPSTLGLFDEKSGALFTCDSFGMFSSRPAQDASDFGEAELVDGFFAFNTINHPWAGLVDQERFNATLEPLQQLRPKCLLSSHMPVVHRQVDALFAAMRRLPTRPAYQLPDQAAVERALASMPPPHAA